VLSSDSVFKIRHRPDHTWDVAHLFFAKCASADGKPDAPGIYALYIANQINAFSQRTPLKDNDHAYLTDLRPHRRLVPLNLADKKHRQRNMNWAETRLHEIADELQPALLEEAVLYLKEKDASGNLSFESKFIEYQVRPDPKNPALRKIRVIARLSHPAEEENDALKTPAEEDAGEKEPTCGFFLSCGKKVTKRVLPSDSFDIKLLYDDGKGNITARDSFLPEEVFSIVKGHFYDCTVLFWRGTSPREWLKNHLVRVVQLTEKTQKFVKEKSGDLKDVFGESNRWGLLVESAIIPATFLSMFLRGGPGAIVGIASTLYGLSKDIGSSFAKDLSKDFGNRLLSPEEKRFVRKEIASLIHNDKIPTETNKILLKPNREILFDLFPNLGFHHPTTDLYNIPPDDPTEDRMIDSGFSTWFCSQFTMPFRVFAEAWGEAAKTSALRTQPKSKLSILTSQMGCRCIMSAHPKATSCSGIIINPSSK
jgi:hypothetical protein